MDFPLHSFSLRQLQYAVAVAELLSFRGAAERCGVSQPSLSAQLGELEAGLGVRLFERDRRRVLVTGAGRDVVERARALLVAAADLADAARRAGDPLLGTIRVGVIPTVSPYLLPRLAPKLRQEFPRLQLLWVEEKTAVVMKRLDEGTLDAALLALDDSMAAYERELLLEDAFVIAAPAGHPLVAKRKAASPEEIGGAGVLLLDEGHCFREQALAFCSKARAHELEFRATSLPTLVQMVASGAGVTLLPEMSIASEAGRAGLVTRRFRDPQPHRRIALLWRRGSAPDLAFRTIAETIRRALARPGAQPDAVSRS